MRGNSESYETKLFLSCDIINSTALKQIYSANWRKPFLSLYYQFPRELRSAQAQRQTLDLEFQLWKPVGDELIYQLSVQSEREIIRAVDTWLLAMSKFNESIIFETDDGQRSKDALRVKGGAFTATFPAPDSEASIPRAPVEEYSYDELENLNRRAIEARDETKNLFDYFGPSIDAGFRILSNSSPDYFVCSVEVIWALLEGRSQLDSPGLTGHIHFLGLTDMKGVWRGNAYPLFAIDLDGDSPVRQAFKKMTGSELPESEIMAYCEEVMADGTLPASLFLPKSASEKRRSAPNYPRPKKSVLDESLVGIESQIEEPKDGVDLPENVPFVLGESRLG